MSRMSILNAPGQQTEGFCMVKSAALRTDSKGGAYMDMVLADAGGECVAKIWNYGPSMGMFEPEDIVKVRGTVTIWKDSEQLKIERIRQATEADQVDMSKIVPCSPQDPDAAYEILWRETEAFKDQDLKRLVQYLMKEHKREMLYYPAAVKLHHATRGGFLEHTLNIVSLGKAVAARYDHLDGELIVAGAILHDIGKLTELDTGKLGVASAYTAEGQLLGHINIGMAEVRSAAELLQVPEETAILLEHMLLSHHGQPEFGSPKLPMFPEAEVLSTLDRLDAQLFEMFTALDGVLKGGFSERQWALDNRQLYQHGLSFSFCAAFFFSLKRKSGKIKYLSPFPALRQLETLVQQEPQSIFVRGAIQKDGDPVDLAHVPGRKDARLAPKHAGEHRVALQIHRVHLSVLAGIGVAPGDRHGQGKPLPVVGVAEHGPLRRIQPGIVRRHPVLPLDVGEQLFLGHGFT